MLYYLLIINVLGVIILGIDKRAAVKDRRRVPEKILHLLEFCGGVFLMIPAMYIFHHKNRKAGYFLFSYLILFIWLFGLYVYFFNL